MHLHRPHREMALALERKNKRQHSQMSRIIQYPCSASLRPVCSCMEILPQAFSRWQVQTESLGACRRTPMEAMFIFEYIAWRI